MAEKLEEAAIARSLTNLPDWKREDKTILRRYRFGSFRSAIAFVNAVAELAEARNHHPFIAVDFKLVTVRLTSWHAGGLTDDDFTEAELVDGMYREMVTNAQQPEQ
ncbi:4a-hydroxytetrahydrobiopterin dehydratase [Alicyclobacillus sp. ALC3]|uniref:4a-hydroxytetrahydrobiopterin dehydratase n=1 Tax=Alicyclobacillus sp. ALC3 TaxID=2796143 RepID=UPI0023793473|nr:4a-hydroxytetrahydrobiopterin dehydratase [Alicyclobacillus sp. ALC3]WDL98736.1 4a-hydroxytetrahydrobiopterin dehydratase [Alicyclobacillus sp. ALC3]